jgi:predicted  nucleic acid-binding Zn-ribbon protein
MAGDESTKPVTSENLKLLKHDIRNQLSNFQLALEGLKYEVSDHETDLSLYFDSMFKSAKEIDKLLNRVE